MKNQYNKLKYGISNLIKWFPVIWKDRDWDQSFLLDVMSFKMKQMAELNRNYGHAVNSDEIADQLDECSSLAQRVSDENYTDEAFGDEVYLIDKTKYESVDTGKGYSTLKITGLTEEEKKRKFELYDKENELLEKDLDLLFETMRKNIRSWWD